MNSIPYLRIHLPTGHIEHLPLDKPEVNIGRDEDAEYPVPAGLNFVSGQNLQIRREGNQILLTALGEANTTRVNGHALEPNTPTPLHSGAIVRMNDDRFGASLGMTFINPLDTRPPVEGYTRAGNPIPLAQPGTLLIGRSADSDIVVDSHYASRQHARLLITDGALAIEDLHSRNGTFVNGQAVSLRVLANGDVVQIGDVVLHYQGEELSRYESVGIRVDVVEMSKEVRIRGKLVRILDNISLSVLPREFIGIVGGSGAGKTTLLNALIGIRPGDGHVYLDRRDFYREYQQYRSQLGYVPQSDILHMTLTVDKALDYSARLRLPGSISLKERQARIDAVLETVSMNTVQFRNTRVGDLSGGQRKRISIAVELLADPKLIYLDEATSGLDPGLEKKMMHTLRRMADEGRTVILVTHATANIVNTDHVAFLSGGELVYFGPPRETLAYFEVSDFADIYEKVEGSGPAWRHVFEETRPAHYQKYVVERLSSAPPLQTRAHVTRGSAVADSIRQFWVLTQRTLSVLVSDPITLWLMLLLFPVTAILQLVIATPEALTGNPSILADAVTAAKNITSSYIPLPASNIFIFVMGLEAVLVGLYVPPNELIRERSIFVRERLVNLHVLPYLLSKVAVYAVFSALQVILYLVVLSFGVRFPAQGLYFPGVVELGLTLFMTMMAGIGAGMIVAAISKSIDMAIYILVMLLFFQFFFAGTVFDLRGNAFEHLSYLSTTRWSLNALGVTVDLQRLASGTILCNAVPPNPLVPGSAATTVCFNYPEAKKDLTLNYDKDMLLEAWGVLAGMTLLSLGVTGVLLNRITTD